MNDHDDGVVDVHRQQQLDVCGIINDEPMMLSEPPSARATASLALHGNDTKPRHAMTCC
jgi:hypothetical protein